ncbi:MAG: hypothetical protein ACI4FX_11390 [Agathobacter sp.]
MIAEKNPILQQASNDLYTINADEIMRQQARARADAEFWERHTKVKLQKQEETIQQQAEQLKEKDKEIERLRAQLAAQNK